MSTRRVVYALAAVELTVSLLVGTQLMEAVSGVGFPEVVGFVSDLLGGLDLGKLIGLIFSSFAS
jgi:hypothetical protein